MKLWAWIPWSLVVISIGLLICAGIDIYLITNFLGVRFPFHFVELANTFLLLAICSKLFGSSGCSKEEKREPR